MLKWKKNKTGEVATEILTDSSDGPSSEIDLTWLGRIASLEEAIQLAQQLQSQGSATQPTATSSSSGASTLAAPDPSGADVDLTVSGNSGSVGTAVFQATPPLSGGTGVFDTFVQIQHNGNEHGYNTDHRPQQFNEANSAQHNHHLLLSNIAIVFGDGTGGTNEGTAYREFLLDANEQTGGDKNFLSLDRLQIFQETSGGLTGFTPGVGFGATGEHLVYDLDAGGDAWIALNANLSSGSGQSDIRVLIPDVLFDQSLGYVVVYSGFGFQGNGWTTDGGFEEWGTDTANSAGGGGPFALNVTKTATVPDGTVDTAGEDISYTIQLHNTGTANLTGITVVDPFVSNLMRVSGDIDNDNVLDVGETWNYTANHTVTQADIDSADNGGFITNTVTADSNETGPDTASASVPVERNQHVTLVKNGVVVDGAVDQAGDVIHYRILVTNDGNVTLTNPAVSDPSLGDPSPVLDFNAPVVNPDAQVFIPITDGDSNLGDNDNDGIEEATDHNGVQDAGETFQYVYRGDTDEDGFHDPGETWAAFNLGDANNNNIHEGSETWIGDANQNGIEEDGERWQFKNLGDTNSDNLQNNGETWEYANRGDTNQNGVEDNGETFEYVNAGDTNQNSVEDAGETFQYYNAGDTNRNGVEDDGETFQFTVTSNLTGVDADNDTFNDGDTNQDGKLSVGETWKYTGSYTATQNDIDNRDGNGVPTVEPGLTHDNTASVDTNEAATDEGSASVPIHQDPDLDVDKTVSGITSTDEAEGTTEVDAAGDVIHYTVTVANTGNMTLTGVSVDDPSTDLTYASGDTNEDGELDLGETWTYTGSYTATQDDIDNRDGEGVPTVDPDLTHDNTATAATDQAATDDGSASVPIHQDPRLVIEKTVTGITSTDEAEGTTEVDAEGDVVHYTVTVANTGNMTLTGVTVSDPLVTDFAYVSGDANNDGELDLGESWTYTGSYTATQDDIDNNGMVDENLRINNTASADSVQTDPESASASVDVDQNPDLRITKTADVASVDSAGDVINYTVEVSNLGNMTLTGVTVTDPLATNLAYASGDADNDGKLDLTETWIYQGSYAVQQSDIDNNGIDANGQGDGDGDIDNTATADSAQTDPESASHAVAVVYNPDLRITKAADVASVDAAGDVINYTVTVANLGNVTLTGVAVSDSLTTLTLASGDADNDGKLDLTETWTYTGSYTVQQSDIDNNGGGDGDIDNTATVDTAQTDPESASASVAVQQPENASMTLTKTALGYHDLNNNSVADVGDTIDYSFLVLNDGNVTLHNIGVSDPDGVVNPVGSLIASLAPGVSDSNYSATHTIVQHDVDDGFFDNTAVAVADETSTSSGTVHVVLADLILLI